MSEIRHREVADDSGSNPLDATDLSMGDAAEKESTSPPGVDLGASQTIPQGTDATPSILKSTLEVLPPRWRNWVIRGIFSVIMILGFSFVIYLGPLALVSLVLAIQMLCFHEIINIGYIVYKSQDLPWFRTLSWYFLFASNYFFFGESLVGNFQILLAKEEFLQPLLTYNRFISFCLYCGGVVAFVMSLVKKHYLQQFTLFGWTHVTLLIIVSSSHCLMNNIFNGVIWFLVPVSMIICNDIMAYIFGFFFGKTPLIKLSPKKTWEGFIGGGLSTLVFGVLFSWILLQSDYFVCPIEYDDVRGIVTNECIRNRVFSPVHFHIPKWMNNDQDNIWRDDYKFLIPFKTLTWYPFFGHCLVLGTFASVVGPFGGFFASGFKRAFKIKDFGDIIPGHGGIMDRFDCQVLMGTFVYVYYQSFIMISSPRALLQQIFVMQPDQQLEFYQLLTEGLIRRGILNSTIS